MGTAVVDYFRRADGLLSSDYFGQTTFVGSGDFARIVQKPQLKKVTLGMLCKTEKQGTADAMAASTGREECDHALHLVDLINDKTDGFLDDLLPGVQLSVVEAKIGCVNDLGESAVASVRAQSPADPVAIFGTICSNDVMDISEADFRARVGWEGVVLSGSSTAPSAAQEGRYPKLARFATSEVHVSRGCASLAKQWGWKRIAVVYDNSAWATEAAQAFIAEHMKREGAVILNTGDSLTQGFNIEEFDKGKIDVKVSPPTGQILTLLLTSHLSPHSSIHPHPSPFTLHP